MIKKIELNYKGHDYSYSKRIESNLVDDYVFHHLTVVKELIIGDRKFDLIYDTGCSFYHNNYSLPSPNLTLDIDSETPEFACEISRMYEQDLSDEALKYLHDEYGAHFIETIDELQEIYTLITEQVDCADDYISDEDVTFEESKF
jgi:hypothetical protein